MAPTARPPAHLRGERREHRHRAGPPYMLAYATLEEPTMPANLVGCDRDALAIGQAVKGVAVSSEGGQPVPVFTAA